MKVLEIEGIACVYFIIDVFDHATVGRRCASNMNTETVNGYYTAEFEEQIYAGPTNAKELVRI